MWLIAWLVFMSIKQWCGVVWNISLMTMTIKIMTEKWGTRQKKLYVKNNNVIYLDVSNNPKEWCNESYNLIVCIKIWPLC